MGQHKHNPNCKLAEAGKLPPKPKKVGAAERRAVLYKAVETVMLERLFIRKDGNKNE